ARSLRALGEIDLFLPNQREAALMTGETEPETMLRALGDAGARGAALKLGAQGAMLLWRGEILRGEPYPVEPVDTTGAGDCFDAGFFFAQLQDEPPMKRLQFGNVCGALSTRAAGGVAAFPALDELIRTINTA